MPGVVKEDLSINMDNGMLYLSGIRKLKTKWTAAWEEFGNVEYIKSFSMSLTIDYKQSGS